MEIERLRVKREISATPPDRFICDQARFTVKRGVVEMIRLLVHCLDFYALRFEKFKDEKVRRI